MPIQRQDLADWERELLYGHPASVTIRYHDVTCAKCMYVTRISVPSSIGSTSGPDYAGEADRLRREVTDLRSQVTGLHRQVDELDAVKVELNKELVAMRERLAEVEEESKHHGELLAAMTTERNALDEEADLLAGALEEVADERDYLRDTVAWAEGELLKAWEGQEESNAA